MRVVVTGFGLVTAVGGNADQTWEALVQARSGIGPTDIISTVGLDSLMSGQVRSEPEPPEGPDRCVRLGSIALREAWGRSGLRDNNPYSPKDCGLVVGTLSGEARSAEAFHRQWISQGLAAADKRLLFGYPLHSIADALAAEFDLRGPRVVHSNACAAGAVAISHGFELIHDGQARMVIAGGVDPLTYLSFAGFSCLGSLSSLNCAPYTRSDGLNLGEGAGFLILEEYTQATARQADIFAEILGFGLSADAYHPTAPDPRGKGALAAINSALSLAGLESSDIGYVNGHGTGTPANDSGELKTIQAIGAGTTPMTSTKSMIGHTLGAAGAVEAVVSVMTLMHQQIHPTFVPPDDGAQAGLAKTEKAGIDIVPNQARTVAMDAVVSNSFAFGGNNASLVLAREGRFDADPGQPRLLQRDIVVTGLAAMAGRAMTTDEVGQAIATGRRLYEDEVEIEGGDRFPVGLPDAARLCPGINPRVLRRLDPLSKLAVHVVGQLFAGHPLSASQLSSTGVIFATAYGPLSTVEAFQRGLIVNGRGDSRLFPNTVMNAAAGHVAVTFGLHGPTATICSGPTSGIAALQLASQMLRNHSCERIIVVGADETPDCFVACYSKYSNYLSHSHLEPYGDTGVVFSSGAVAVLLEAESPTTLVLARIPGIGMASDTCGSGGFSIDAEAWTRSLHLAMDRAGVTPADIDMVIAAANGRDRTDDVEREAISRLGLDKATLVAPRAVTGDLSAASPLLGIPLATWTKAGERLTALVSGFSIGGSFHSYVVEV